MVFFRSIWMRYVWVIPFIASLFMVTGRWSLQNNVESTQEIVTKNLLTIWWSLLIIWIWSSINLYWVNSLLSAGYIILLTTLLLQASYRLQLDQVKQQTWWWLLVWGWLFLFSRYMQTSIWLEYAVWLLLCIFSANIASLYWVQGQKTSDLLSQHIISSGAMIAWWLLIATGINQGYGLIITQAVWSLLIYGHFIWEEWTTKFDSQRSDLWSLVRGKTLSQIRLLKEHDIIHSITKLLPLQHFKLLYGISTSISAISLLYLGYLIRTWTASTAAIVCSFIVIGIHTVTMALSDKEYMHQHIEILSFSFWYILVYYMIAISPLTLLISIITWLVWYILNGVLLNNYGFVTERFLSKQTYMQWLWINTAWAVINILMLLSLNADISTTVTLLLLFAWAIMMLTSYNWKFIQTQPWIDW